MSKWDGAAAFALMLIMVGFFSGIAASGASLAIMLPVGALLWWMVGVLSPQAESKND